MVYVLLKRRSNSIIKIVFDGIFYRCQRFILYKVGLEPETYFLPYGRYTVDICSLVLFSNRLLELFVNPKQRFR